MAQCLFLALACAALSPPALASFTYIVSTNLAGNVLTSSSGQSTLSFSMGPAQQADCAGAGTDISLAGLSVQSSSFPPDTLNGGYTLTVSITDGASGQVGEAILSGQISGSVSMDSTDLQNIWLPPASVAVSIGGTDYVVSAGFFFAPSSFGPGFITGHVTCSAAGPKTVYVRAAAETGGDGSSWVKAFQKVQDGVNAAATGDEVRVAGGMYTEHITIAPGVKVLGGYAGTGANPDLRDPAANASILDGGGAAASAVVTFAAAPGSSILDGVTVQNGGTNGVEAAGEAPQVAGCTIENNAGSGLHAKDSSPVVSGCTITRNGTASADGGGISIENGGPNTRVTGNTITANQGASGGGIRFLASSGLIASNLIARNTADQGAGVWAGGTVQVVNNTIVENTGGGVRLEAGASGANNIVATNAPNGVSLADGTAWKSNDVWSNADTNYTGADQAGQNGNISVDPAFVDAAAGNYHVCHASLTLNMGDDASVAAGAKDLDGNPRKVDPHVDLGAYESTVAAYTVDEASRAASIAAGLALASAADVARLDMDCSGPGAGVVEIADAVRILNRVAGLRPNP